jgi:protease IV
VREDGSIKSVVLRIESPGGSSMAADVMWREIRLLAEQKPVIVSMGSVAASGGYYIAAAGKEIYALPLTVTGSIGIFYGKADLSGLLGKLGVTTETYKTTPRADAESLFRGFTPDERQELEHKVGQFYDVFLDRVSQGRHMTKAEVDAVGQGRVWTGQEAIEHKLVDKLGGLREALAEARTLGNLPSDAPIEELPVVEQSLLEQVLGINAVTHAMTIDNLPVQIRDVARAVAPMVVYSKDIPMARMEYVPLEDE